MSRRRAPATDVAPPAGHLERLELPTPPEDVREAYLPTFVRSREMEAFFRDVWIDPEGPLGFTGDFAHLQHAEIGVLWTNVSAPVANSGGKYTAGMAMIYAPRPGRKWMMAMQDAQMHAWFGEQLPDFVIIISAAFWAAETIRVARKLALATHELLHCGQAQDEFGQPKVYRQGPRRGKPVFCLAPHPVEEFPLVVLWFGAAAASPGVEELLWAAKQQPLMEAVVDERFACGSCAMAA